MFPQKIKTRSFRKIVFRGTRGVTSDGAQDLEIGCFFSTRSVLAICSSLPVHFPSQWMGGTSTLNGLVLRLAYFLRALG